MSPARGKSMSRATLKAALEKPNVAAFLKLIRVSLGRDNEAGYVEKFGAYNISYEQWRALRNRFGFPDDFDNAAQDEAAVAMIDNRSALTDVLSGRFADAMRKCGREWPCLPCVRADLVDAEFARALAEFKAHQGITT